ncbi:MAG: succinyl-diaminopimelate desuccinylase [Alphaproteobacteria bacterium]|nr:succinyl-diaminopimelate desuccinylase [Alphaproteobacteria bacterium]
MQNATDPVALTQALVRCASVTPQDAGALDVLTAALEPLGFTCTKLPYGEGLERVPNLFARLGSGAPHFCFAGHTDVVPVGSAAQWRFQPFEARIADGILYGRGTADMKGAVACFVAAASRLRAEGLPSKGSISLLITGDEEGPARNGTRRVLEWMRANNHVPDVALVGEPTSPDRVGQAIKIGRRGSMTGHLLVRGVQGHVAYPHIADNPLPKIVRMLAALTEAPLDRGNERFEASNLEVTTVDVGNPATNVIPAEARATFNIRFNDNHTSAALEKWMRGRLDSVGATYELSVEVSGEAFVTKAGPFTDLLRTAIAAQFGSPPEFSTSGGTSDARFIKDYCPVAEFGLVNRTIHKVDEHVALADLAVLTDAYTRILRGYFA